MNKHGKMASLITATVVLIIAAIAIFSVQLGLFGPIPAAQRKNHSEVRAMYDPSIKESTAVVVKE